MYAGTTCNAEEAGAGTMAGRRELGGEKETPRQKPQSEASAVGGSGGGGGGGGGGDGVGRWWWLRLL